MSKKLYGPDSKRLMTRTTIKEYDAWIVAAEKQARELGIPPERLTIGVWSRMVLNKAARELGVEIPVED